MYLDLSRESANEITDLYHSTMQRVKKLQVSRTCNFSVMYQLYTTGRTMTNTRNYDITLLLSDTNTVINDQSFIKGICVCAGGGTFSKVTFEKSALHPMLLALL